MNLQKETKAPQTTLRFISKWYFSFICFVNGGNLKNLPVNFLSPSTNTINNQMNDFISSTVN